MKLFDPEFHIVGSMSSLESLAELCERQRSPERSPRRAAPMEDVAVGQGDLTDSEASVVDVSMESIAPVVQRPYPVSPTSKMQQARSLGALGESYNVSEGAGGRAG